MKWRRMTPSDDVDTPLSYNFYTSNFHTVRFECLSVESGGVRSLGYSHECSDMSDSIREKQPASFASRQHYQGGDSLVCP